jgi:hypothetical protein
MEWKKVLEELIGACVIRNNFKVKLTEKKILSFPITVEEELGHMKGKKVLEELVSVPPHLGHLLQLLPGLLLPQEVQGRGNLNLDRK